MRLEFDTIYHEHLFYYSLTSLSAAARSAHGLGQRSMSTRIPIHGGSLRVDGLVSGSASASSAAKTALLEEEEAEWGVCEPETYSEFRLAPWTSGAREIRELLLRPQRPKAGGSLPTAPRRRG